MPDVRLPSRGLKTTRAAARAVENVRGEFIVRVIGGPRPRAPAGSGDTLTADRCDGRKPSGQDAFSERRLTWRAAFAGRGRWISIPSARRVYHVTTDRMAGEGPLPL